jgi:hypothetical protein
VRRQPRGDSISATGSRLLDMRQAAEYLGCSYWTVRDYVLAGYVATVELPPLRPREGERQRKRLRRVLIDRVDLDLFVDRLKNPGARDGRAPAPLDRPMDTRPNRDGVPVVCPDPNAAGGATQSRVHAAKGTSTAVVPPFPLMAAHQPTTVCRRGLWRYDENDGRPVPSRYREPEVTGRLGNADERIR